MKTYEIRRVGSAYGRSIMVKADGPGEAIDLLLDITADRRGIISVKGDEVIIQNGWTLLVREIPS